MDGGPWSPIATLSISSHPTKSILKGAIHTPCHSRARSSQCRLLDHHPSLLLLCWCLCVNVSTRGFFPTESWRKKRHFASYCVPKSNVLTPLKKVFDVKKTSSKIVFKLDAVYCILQNPKNLLAMTNVYYQLIPLSYFFKRAKRVCF